MSPCIFSALGEDTRDPVTKKDTPFSYCYSHDFSSLLASGRLGRSRHPLRTLCEESGQKAAEASCWSWFGCDATFDRIAIVESAPRGPVGVLHTRLQNPFDALAQAAVAQECSHAARRAERSDVVSRALIVDARRSSVVVHGGTRCDLDGRH